MSSTNEIKLDKRNYRKHNDENKRLIKKSLEECGTGRSIVIDNDNEVICGNGVFESAKELGIPVKVIETTGNEVIAIKRTDLNRNDEKRDKLAILDNSTSDLSEFDYDLLKEDFEEDYLNSLGIEQVDNSISMEDAECDMPILASGDKAPFQQMTFTLADNQAEVIKEALAQIKQTEQYKYVETFGNENTNGNALYCIIERFING